MTRLDWRAEARAGISPRRATHFGETFGFLGRPRNRRFGAAKVSKVLEERRSKPPRFRRPSRCEGFPALLGRRGPSKTPAAALRSNSGAESVHEACCARASAPCGARRIQRGEGNNQQPNTETKGAVETTGPWPFGGTLDLRPGFDPLTPPRDPLYFFLNGVGNSQRWPKGRIHCEIRLGAASACTDLQDFQIVSYVVNVMHLIV